MRSTLNILTIAAVLLGITAVGQAQLITSSTDLPPDGVYVSPADFHTYSAMGIILDDPSHTPFVGGAIRERVGDDELETFDSEFSAIEIGGGPTSVPGGLGPITLTGPVTVLTSNRYLSTTGTFDTEIVAMSLSGNVPGVGLIAIRQDQARQTLGQTSITDLGGGLYQIDSFFDVFTELSVDGGGSWIPSDTSTHMFLVPEPTTLTLLAVVSLALIRRRR